MVGDRCLQLYCSGLNPIFQCSNKRKYVECISINIPYEQLIRIYIYIYIYIYIITNGIPLNIYSIF